MRRAMIKWDCSLCTDLLTFFLWLRKILKILAKRSLEVV
jgi:hypothetical protein